jgi:hypothetical protein
LTSLFFTSALNSYSQSLSSQDKLGNTQIQMLMSNYNEVQTTLASVQKALHDAHSSVIGKI